MPNEYVERIVNSGPYKKLNEIVDLIEGINITELPEDHRNRFQRISYIMNFLKNLLDTADPFLIPINSLNNIQNLLNQLHAELTNYSTDKNPTRLNNMMNNVEAILPTVPHFQLIKNSEGIESLRSSVISFRKSMGQHIGNFEKEVNESRSTFSDTRKAFTELKKSIEQQTARIDPMVTDFQENFRKAQDERNDKFNEFIEKTKNEINSLIDSSETAFEEQLDQQVKEFEIRIDEKEKAFNQMITDANEQIKAELDGIKKMNKDAEKILGLMSMKGMASGYQKIANSENRRAITWSTIAVFSLAALLYVGYEFIINQGSEMTWITLTSRLIITGVGLTLFTYGAKQAGHHRAEERRNRKIELELASLDPYLKDLEEEKRKEVKQSLVGKFFGVELPSDSFKNSQPTQQDILATIQNNPVLIQTIADLVKKP